VLEDRTRPPRTLGGRHDACLLADGTLTPYDDRQLSPARAPGTATAPGHPATDGAGARAALRPARRSLCCGRARQLPGGHWAISWADRPLITELASGGRVFFFRLLLGKLFSYRAFPISRGRLDPPGTTPRDGRDAALARARPRRADRRPAHERSLGALAAGRLRAPRR